MEIWKTIAWSPEQVQILYREWGIFYTKKQHPDVADFYYNNSLDINPDDPKALHFRSKCKRHIALNEQALIDARRAVELDEHSQLYNLEVCDGVYELNDFEQCKNLLSSYSRKFMGKKLDAFTNREDVLDMNFIDTMGCKLGFFILKNDKLFEKAYRKVLSQKHIDSRPIWKTMKEQEKCDILSILETEKEILCPREVARRKRAFCMFNQIYLKNNWIDVVFLKALTTDKNLLLPQSHMSRPLLEDLTKQKFNVVLKKLKMLNVRSPLYTEHYKKFPNRTMRQKQTEAFLYLIQNQLHRRLIKMLKTMHVLRANGNLRKLRRYVEQVMGDYVVLKTHRVMPAKFQFINEVYNILALAYCDQFTQVPKNITDIPQRFRLLAVLKVKTDLDKEQVSFEFGKRATYQDVEAADKTWNFHKAFRVRLKKRMLFAKYHIEKAYLWHELARSLLKNNLYDKSRLFAERCIAEAKKCNSFVWMLHGTILICKTHAILLKIERVSISLARALTIAKTLKSEPIINYLQICESLNKIDINVKKRTESLRMSKSKLSFQNRSSRSIRSEDSMK